MNRASFVVSGIAVVVLVVIIAVVVGLWTRVGDSDITPAGWFAMALGIVVTLAVGIGLMALVFISNRRGYDEQTGGR